MYKIVRTIIVLSKPALDNIKMILVSKSLYTGNYILVNPLYILVCIEGMVFQNYF